MHTIWLICCLGLQSTLFATNATSEASVQNGLQLLHAWQLEQALPIAEHLLYTHPNDPEVLWLAAQTLFEQGQHTQALTLMQASQTTWPTPNNAADVIPLIQTAATYDRLFSTLVTPHFRIRYLNKDEIVATYAQDVLESAYQRIGAALQFVPTEPSLKITVEIYPDAKALAAASGLTYKQIATSGTIAICKYHRIMLISPLAVADGYLWADTLAHELTHLFISKKSHNSIPIWLHEGIAKFYESMWRGKPGLALTPAAQNLLAQAVKNNKFITLEQMQPSMALLPSQQDALLAFAEVFSIVENIHRQHGHAAIAKILSRCAAGLSVNQALTEVLHMDEQTLQKTWIAQLQRRHWEPTQENTWQPLVLLQQEATTTATPAKPDTSVQDTPKARFCRLGELLQNNGHTQAAVVEYQKALQLADHQPDGPLVQRLGTALRDLKRFGELKALLEPYVQRYPQDHAAHLLLAQAALELEELQNAQHHFKIAYLQNPFNPEIHTALAHIAKEQGNQTVASQEERFAKLCQQPRPEKAASVPPQSLPQGAFLNLVTKHWGIVYVDQNVPLNTPIYHWPITAGQHTLRYSLDLNDQQKTFSVTPNQETLLVLP